MKTVIVSQKEIEEEREKTLFIVINGKEYITVSDILKWIPASKVTVCKYLRSGRMEGVKYKRKWYISKENFYNFLEGKSQFIDFKIEALERSKPE